MSLLFLQDLGLNTGTNGAGLGANSLSGLGNGLAGLTIGIIVLYILVILALYFYFSLAFMKIGKKAKLACPGVSWVNPIVSIFEIAKMHWWPWPFLMIGILLGYLVMIGGMLSGSLITMGIFALIGGLILLVTIVVFGIFALIWHWKTFEAVGRPGWWAIISPIIAIIGFLFVLAGIFSPILALLGVILFIIAGILYMVLVGIAAWGR